jgi:hypothetical protein
MYVGLVVDKKAGTTEVYEAPRDQDEIDIWMELRTKFPYSHIKVIRFHTGVYNEMRDWLNHLGFNVKETEKKLRFITKCLCL